METNHWLYGLDRGCLVRGILKRIWMVLLAVVIAVGGMNLLLKAVWKPEYSSSATYAVMSKSGLSTTMGNMSAANEAATMMTEILRSEVMENRIREKLGTAEAGGTLTASVVGETNMLVITATASNSQAAFRMMQVAMDSFDEYFSKIDSTAVLQKVSDARIPLSPDGGRNTGKYLFMAGILGAGAMVLVLLWFHVKADTIQNRQGARKKLDAQILVTLPHEKRQPLLSGKDVSFYFRENMYRLRTRVETAAGEREDAAVILVTSVAEGEGKSSVAANLALALAEKHKGVLLVDADLRSPSLHTLLGEQSGRENGLGYLLRQKQLDVSEIAGTIGYQKKTNLMVMTEKHRYRGSADMLSGAQMTRLISVLRKTVKYIVLDVPTIGMFPDGSVLADMADMSLLVVRQDTASACDINDAVDLLQQSQSGSGFLGCVLNDMRTRAGSGYGYGYSYGYGYGHGHRQGYGYGYGTEDQNSTGRERS